MLWMQDILFAALAGEQRICRVCASNCSASSARRRRVSSKQTSASSSTTGVPCREGQTADRQAQREIERVLRPGAQIPAGAERRFGGLARHDIHLAIQQHPVIFPAGQRGEELARLLGERRGKRLCISAAAS